jgi:3-oxoadipate enol-lactonase
LLLLHSGVCDRRMWDPQWPVLVEAGYRVVRGDFRGFGDSPMADRPYSDVGDVVDLLDALGIGPAALIGSSYGGRVGVEIAARWPDRVTAMALICAGLPGHEPSPELRAGGA